MNFDAWLDTLIDEKGFDAEEMFEVDGPSGVNIMPYQAVFDSMKVTTPDEQAAIKNMIVYIDFKNGDILHYVRHLAQAISI